ncbi:phosphatase PAP2 family protein [Patescibacteria group bacterium]|nr:phosphatase PAP2 family protein [Patescibacteria group bacterium]
MDEKIVNFLYALANSSPAWSLLIIFLAVVLIWLMLFWYIILIFRKNQRTIFDLAISLVGAGSFYVFLLVVNFLWFRPRPFVSLGFTPLINMSPLSSSFPSGHAGLAFLLAYLVAKYQPTSKWLAYSLAGLVALARLGVGVHYFTDVVVSAFLGILFGYLVWIIKEKLLNWRFKKIAKL